MRRLLGILTSIFLGCGSLDSDNTENILTIGGCQVLLPKGWKLELEKSKTITTNGFLITNANDTVKFLRDTPFVRDTTLLDNLNIIQSHTIEDYVIQEADYYGRKRIVVINRESSDTTKEHYYFLAYFHGDIDKKDIGEFTNNIKTAIKEMSESRLEYVKRSYQENTDSLRR